jgi:hypothetical protein
MTPEGALMFAVFSSRERAHRARFELAEHDDHDDHDIDLIVAPHQLRERAAAPALLVRGLGLLLTISLVVGFVIAGLGALVLSAAGVLPQPVPAAYVSAGVAVVLAATLGGLAGWLAFASHSRIELRRLCGLLEHGHALLVFPARRDFGERLRRCGALQIGSLT